MSGIPFHDLRPVHQELSPALEDAAHRVLKSGWYVHGTEHAAFEEEFAAFVGSSGCVAVANGTDALEIAMRALGPRPGSAVVTVANAAMYSTTAALHVGLDVRYAEVQQDDLLLDIARLPALLDDDVSIVVVTHLYGRMVDVAAVLEVCRPRGIRVLEDCAQAVGARLRGHAAGSVGDAAAFSFYPTKNLGAVGDGGAVTSSNNDVLGRARQLRQYGWSSKYNVTLDGGRNSRLDELQAAVLRVKLPYVDVWNSRRREILDRYTASASHDLTVLPTAGERHVAHLAVVAADDRDAWRRHLADKEIGTEIHYPLPDHRQPVMLGRQPDTILPVTEWACDHVFSLPIHPQLTAEQVDSICAAIGKR